MNSRPTKNSSSPPACVRKSEAAIRSLLQHACDAGVSHSDPVLLSRILDDVLEFLRSDFERSNIVVVNRVSNRPSVFVRASAETLYLLVLNLLGSSINAIEAAIAAGRASDHRITLDIEACSRGWRLTLTDTGYGISVQEMRKLLRPLHRLESAGRSTSIITSHRVVRACRGDIAVESEKGVGTKIYVYLAGF